MSSNDASGRSPDPTATSGAEPDPGRYAPEGTPGGDAYLARDRVLDRMVRIRSTDAAGADALQREARFLARLEHPGVAQVHDFVHASAGAMLVQSASEGVTLAEAMLQARQGSVRPELATPGAAVLLMKRVCETLSAAHAKRVVHHRLASTHIVLGGHGQVVVGGWQHAGQEPVNQRFVASSPAPRNMELDDLHADVRSVGRCLFAALAWRELPEDQTAKDWRLDEDERRRMPTQLEAIIRYALTSDSSMGYRSIDEFGDDLLQYLNGMAPSVYRPSWIRAHPWRAAAAAVLAALLAGGVYAAVTAMHAAGHGWGPPLVDEQFNDESWRTRWVEAGKGSFSIENGKLVTQAPRNANLIFRQRLTTPVAIEYTGQLLPGTRPCDLSVIWSERDSLPADPARMLDASRGYLIQAGAHDNSFCGMIAVPKYMRVAHADRQLEVGRDYRFRVEIDGERISMAIDGVLVYEFHDVMPSTSGYIALYGYYPGKAFDDVRIMQKTPSPTVPAITAGDSLFQFRHFADAAAVYGRLADSDQDGAEGQLARFRKGLAEAEMGRLDDSRETWTLLRDPHLRNLADCRRLDDLLAAWQLELLESRFEEWYRTRPDVRTDLRLAWQRLFTTLRQDPRVDEPAIERFIALRERVFPEHTASAGEAASALLTLERYEDILARYPAEHVSCNEARFALGLHNEMKDAGGVIPRDWSRIYKIRGEFDKVFQVPGVSSETLAWIMCKMGRAEEALRVTGENYPTLIHLGRAEELMQSFFTRVGTVDFQTNDCLIAMGKYAEAAGPGWPGLSRSGLSLRGCILLGRLDDADKLWIGSNYWHNPVRTGWARLIVAAEAVNREQIARWRPTATLPRNLARPSGWFAGVVIGPFVDRLGGEAGAVHKSLEHAVLTYPRVFARNAWFFSSYTLGKISEEEFLAMPSVSEATAWLAVAKGLRAELEERPADALAAYKSYADLPSHRRLLDGNTLDVQVELFVAWRLRALAK